MEIVNQVVKDSTSSSSPSSSSSTTKSSSLDRATIEASAIEERILERYSDATTTSKKQPTKKMISRGGAASKAVLERLKIGVYFGLWYALNVVYNSKYDT